MNSLKVFYPNYSPVFLRIKNNHKKTSHNRLVLKGFLVGTRGFEPPPPDTP
nr:MAG TPA: hypothetical protein [Caudoviricetes sp.]